MGHTWQSQLSLGLLVGTCLFAWARGGAAERAGALVLLIANLTADVGMLIAGPRFPTVFMFLCDFGLAVALLVLALRYSSIWLGAAMLLQSAGLGLHGMQLIGDGFSNAVYITAIAVMSNLMLMCIVAGTVASWRMRSQQAVAVAVPVGAG